VKGCEDSEEQYYRVGRRAAREVTLRFTGDDGDVCLMHTGRMGDCEDTADSTFLVARPGSLQKLGHQLTTPTGGCLTSSRSGSISVRDCQDPPDDLQQWLIEVVSEAAALE
jgi:hypothetical protein